MCETDMLFVVFEKLCCSPTRKDYDKKKAVMIINYISFNITLTHAIRQSAQHGFSCSFLIIQK